MTKKVTTIQEERVPCPSCGTECDAVITTVIEEGESGGSKGSSTAIYTPVYSTEDIKKLRDKPKKDKAKKINDNLNDKIHASRRDRPDSYRADATYNRGDEHPYDYSKYAKGGSQYEGRGDSMG